MKEFTDDRDGGWVATAREEETPRHHGRWYLVFHPAGDESRKLVMPEVRWQSRRSAERTLNTMSVFELLRRLHLLLERELVEAGASPETGALQGRERAVNINAG